MDRGKQDSGPDLLPQPTLAAIQDRVRSGRVRIAPHVSVHAMKEGFGVVHVIEAILSGREIERRHQEARCLIYGRAQLTARTTIDLHVVCEYLRPGWVDVVTAYVPDSEEWEVPPVRRRRRR